MLGSFIVQAPSYAKALHVRVQAKAQKQLQQLRLERMGPLDLERAAPSSASDGVDGLTSTSTAPMLHRIDSNAEQDSIAGSGVTEQLPTKAELRGTLGTVNRKVHTATCCVCFVMTRSALPASLSGMKHDPTCTCYVWPAAIIRIVACFAVTDFSCTCTCLHSCTYLWL